MKAQRKGYTVYMEANQQQWECCGFECCLRVKGG